MLYSSLEREVTLLRWNKYLSMSVIGLMLSSSASAQAGTSDIAKKLIPYGNELLIAFASLLVVFVGLVIWEVVEQRNSSRSSLDIAKLAAAAQKKKPKASKPTGSASAESPAPTGRPFAPPPPPPPPKAQPAPPPPSSETAGGAESSSPFSPSTEGASPFSPSSEQNPNPLAAPAGSPGFDATVAFSPQDAGSSGGWADLLQRVRAGEPEAASFEDGAPTPSTEVEAGPFAPPAPTGGAPSPLGSPSPTEFLPDAASAPAAGSSSEAWEALLKRTTGGEDSAIPGAVDDSKKVSLNSSFTDPTAGLGSDAPSPASFSPGIEFVAPGEAAPISDSFSLGGSGESSAPNPFGSSIESAPSPFGSSTESAPSFDSSSPPPPSFDLGGSSGETTSVPSFSLSNDPPASPAPSFQLPGADDSAPNPFGGGGNDSSSTSNTMPLSDLFGGAGASPGESPAFQLPPSGAAPSMDFLAGNDGGGRTISLDFSGGGGQTPPAPLPKTEG